MVADHDIARWRVRTQHLAGPGLADPAEVVGSLLAVQAENPSQSAWAVATRTSSPDAADLGAALDDGRLVRTHVLRSTWHYVLAEDLLWLQELTAPRVRRTTVHQLRTDHGLDEATCEQLAGMVLHALSGRHLTRPEVADALTEAGRPLTGRALMVLLADLEMQALVCSGPTVGGLHSYARVADRVSSPRRLSREESLAELALRYFTSHGPATVQDLAYWATLTPTDVRTGLEEVRAHLGSFEHEGRTYWHDPAQRPPRSPVRPTAHLLQILDETYRGYQDSRWVLDAAGVVPRSRETAIGMALVDAQLVAGMKRTVTPRTVTFDLRPHPSWDAAMLPAVEDAAARYARFLEREPVVVLR